MAKTFNCALLLVLCAPSVGAWTLHASTGARGPMARPSADLRAQRFAHPTMQDVDAAGRKKGDPLSAEQRQILKEQQSVTSSGFNNVNQEKAPWIYVAAGFAAIGLTTGGIFEDQVEATFAPVRASGGWGNFLGISVPGQDKANEIKALEKAKKDARKAGVPTAAVFPAADMRA